MKKVLLIVSIVLLVSAFVLGGCNGTTSTPSETAAPPKHLKVGAVMPISGPISTVGMAFVRGYELYFDKVNAAGGIKVGNDTYLVDFMVEDSQVNPEAAGTAANKLVFQDQVKFVFGEILEQDTQAIYDVAAPNGVLHLVSWVNVVGHPADVSPDKPLCVRPNISPDDSDIPLLDYLKEAYPDVKTIALAVPDIIPQPMVDKLKSEITARGIEIVGSEIWEWGVTDYVPLYTKILASNPDAVYAMVSAQASYQLMAARQLGFNGPFISSSPLGPDVFLAVAGPTACTNLICAGWDPAAATGELKEIVDGWKAKWSTEPFVSDAAFAWDQASILVQAIKKAQSVDPAAVLAALDTMTAPGSVQTSFGSARMGGMGTFGVNRVLVRPIPISRIMNGVIESVGFIPIDVD
jgi:branched-chain amino acid transport system substrate-binding protein